MKTSPARRAAYDVLHEVGARSAYANLALASRLANDSMSRPDRGLATDLVYTTLRRRMTLDAVLATAVNRPLSDVDPRVLDVLRLALTEHMYLDKPAHAVVDNAVKLTQAVGAASAKGFVNAVLRRLTAQDAQALLDRATEGLTGDALLEVCHSHPQWIIRAFRDALGSQELVELLERDNQAPRVTLVARPGRIDRDELPGSPPRGHPGASMPNARIPAASTRSVTAAPVCRIWGVN